MGDHAMEDQTVARLHLPPHDLIVVAMSLDIGEGCQLGLVVALTVEV